MKKAVAIRHIAFENLGSFEPLIRQHYQLEYMDAVDNKLKQLKNEDIDLLIVLGGPIGVYQEKEYPFIDIEVELIKKRLALDLPTLGICLGSQLMAKALGAKVYPGPVKEIGWYPITITEDAKNDDIVYLVEEDAIMFHWHGDTFDLPEGAQLLASSEKCKHQIFSWKKNAIAFQCHPEVTAELLEHWWIGHTGEISSLNLSINELRDDSYKLAPQLELQSSKWLKGWLNKILSI